MIGLAAGQLLFGPLSDKYGRRLPLIISMIFVCCCYYWMYIFLYYNAVCWLALDTRYSGAGGIVISRSVAADKYSGRELAKMLA